MNTDFQICKLISFQLRQREGKEAGRGRMEDGEERARERERENEYRIGECDCDFDTVNPSFAFQNRQYSLPVLLY